MCIYICVFIYCILERIDFLQLCHFVFETVASVAQDVFDWETNLGSCQAASSLSVSEGCEGVLMASLTALLSRREIKARPPQGSGTAVFRPFSDRRAVVLSLLFVPFSLDALSSRCRVPRVCLGVASALSWLGFRVKPQRNLVCGRHCWGSVNLIS